MGGVYIKSKYNYSAKQYLMFFVTACILTLIAFAVTTRTGEENAVATSAVVQTESEPAKETDISPELTYSMLESDNEKTETEIDAEKEISATVDSASSKTESTSSKTASSKTESASAKSNSSKTESASAKSNSSKTESTSSKSNSSKTESTSSKSNSSKTESASAKSNSSKTESASSKTSSSKTESTASEKSQSNADKTESKSETTVKTKTPPKEYHIEVEHISQNNVMPTGCEIVSTKMVLDYYGMERLSLDDMLERLNCSELKFSKDGKLYGLSPFQAFIGNPKKTNGFGCYPPVIMDMIENFEFGNLYAEDTSSLPLDFVAETYVTQDIPVLVWVTIGMCDSYLTDSWYLCDENGKITKEKYTWRAEEHCMVLIGYDEKYYYFCDPLSEKDVVKYEKSLVEKRYKEIGSYSLIIRKGTY